MNYQNFSTEQEHFELESSLFLIEQGYSDLNGKWKPLLRPSEIQRLVEKIESDVCRNQRISCLGWNFERSVFVFGGFNQVIEISLFCLFH